MAENPEVPEESEDVSFAQRATQLPDESTPLHELALSTHELYRELKSVGFPTRSLNQIMAIMLSDVITGRIFEDDFGDDDEWDDIDEGDFNNDGNDPN